MEITTEDCESQSMMPSQKKTIEPSPRFAVGFSILLFIIGFILSCTWQAADPYKQFHLCFMTTALQADPYLLEPSSVPSLPKCLLQVCPKETS